MKNIFKNSLTFLLVLLSITAYSEKKDTKYYLSITHEVADYDNWKVVFDKFRTERTEAGIVDIFVKQNINNTNSITVFSRILDMTKAEQFMASNQLKDAMKNAGVVSNPEIIFYKSAEEYSTINKAALVTTITHSVNSYVNWERVYNSASKLRIDQGITDHLVLKSLANENMITIIGSSRSAAQFNTFMANPDLKKAMNEAGVTSKPELVVLL
jgi:hypothetical protein